MAKIVKKCLTCGNENSGTGRYCPVCEDFFRKIDSQKHKCFSEAPYTGAGMPGI